MPDLPGPRGGDGRYEAVVELAPGVVLLGCPYDDGRHLARRADGRVVRMPWFLYRVAVLIDGTRDLSAVAERLRAEVGQPLVAEDVRLAIERRLVPAGLVSPLDGPPPRRRPVSRLAALTADPAQPPSWRRIAGASSLTALALVMITVAVTVWMVGPSGGPAAAPAAARSAVVDAPAPAGLRGPPTVLGRVVEVPDVTSAVVDVDGRPLRVDVVGLTADGTSPCAAAATDFARRTLLGHEVTVVPDPTVPVDERGAWPAYLVTADQLSFTDAALRAGWATAGEGRYRAGFLAEQAEAQRAGLGLTGPACRPPR